MSISVMSWVWANGPADASMRLVLLAIADHADDKGVAYPSMAGIAAKSCVTERGARGIVRRLEDAGWLKTRVGGGRGGKSVYTVVMHRNTEQETGNEKPGITNTEPETRNVATQNPERGDTKPGTSVPPNHHRTIKEPSNKIRASLCEVLSEEAADDFIAHRKAKRAKLTERAADLIAKSLRGHPDPDAVVAASIMNGWTGVFPDKSTPKRNQREGPDLDALFASLSQQGAAQ